MLAMGGKRIVYCYTGSIFTYQYSHAWIDFRSPGEDAAGIDYYANSVNATKANRDFCIDNAANHKTYGDSLTGSITFRVSKWFLRTPRLSDSQFDYQQSLYTLQHS